MKTNKKFFSIFLAMILIVLTIFPSFAAGIHADPVQETYRSGQWLTLTAESGQDGHMKWYEIDPKGEKQEWTNTKKICNHYIYAFNDSLFNDTKETVSTVVYAVYETVSGSVYQNMEIKVEPDPERLEIVDMYPQYGDKGVKKDAEISVTFNQPVEFNEENTASRQVKVRYDENEDGRVVEYYPNKEASYKNKLIFRDETPNKVIIQICDENENPIHMKESYEYKIDVYPRWIQAKMRNPFHESEYANEFVKYRFDTYPIPKTIKINKPNKTIYTGESVQLTVTGISDEGKNIVDYQPVWGTSNPNIALVDEKGVFRARTAGKVTVYASIEGKEDQKEAIEIEIKKENEYSQRIKAAIDGAINVGLDNNNSMDWIVVGLARAGKTDQIPENYIKNVEAKLKKNNGEFPNTPTEYARMTLGVLAAGKNPRNIAGYDLIEKICNADLEDQGMNSVIFGLIALDAGEYDIHKDAKWTREKIITNILENECHYIQDGKEFEGGWSLKSEKDTNPPSDPDITGMAITALAPYNNDKYPKVKEAVDRAVKFLSAVQKDSGGYFSWDTANSESCSQVIMGLCTNGIDPVSEKFTKNGNNLIDGLLSFELPEHGGFAHMLVQGRLELDGMGNEQALYALDQYMYYLEGKGSIYQWGKDNIAPSIDVKNLPSDIVSQDGKLEFEVYVKDNRDEHIVPEVKFENKVVIKNQAGKYDIQIKEGKNKITIVAEDTLNNKAVKEYTIIRYKQKYPVGQKIQLQNNLPIKLQGANGEIDIDLEGIELEKEASLNVSDETENELYQPSKDTGLKVVGPIMNFDFEGAHIDQQHSVTLKLSAKEGMDTNKSSIYYFNDQTKEWEYIASTYKNGKFIAQVTHFSVYGIMTDEKAPENVCVQSKMVSSDKVLLNMSADDDSFIKAYQIFRDNFEGAPKAVISKSEYLDIDVKANTQYQYKIKAVDVFGNVSDFSEVLDITTPDTSTSGEEEQKEETTSVYLRIEGYDHTILSRTKIQVPLFDLTEYVRKGTGDSATDGGNWGVDKFKSPTVAHAIIKALENNGISYDFQDYGWGLYVAMIDGEREKDYKGMSGWMYRLNNKLPSIGCQGKSISDNNELVWYYGAYGFDNVYTKMNVDQSSIPVGGEVKIHADGYENGFSNNVSSLKEATVLVNGEPFEMEGKVVKTDNAGNATLKFDENGTYKISLIRYAKKGKYYIDIVRPVPISIKVGTGESNHVELKVENSEYKEESKIVNDQNAKESEVIKAVDKVTEKLSKNADAVKSEDDAKKMISHGKDVSKIMEKAIERVKNEDSAKDIAKQSTKVVELLGKSLKRLTKDEDKKKMSKVIVESIKITLKAIDKIKDQADLNEIVGNMIDIIKNLSKDIGEKNEKEVIENVVKIAEKIVEKATVKEFDKNELILEKEKAIAIVDKNTMKEMAKNTAITVKTIKDKLKKNGFESKKAMENKVTIEIPKTDKKEIETKLPKDAMKILQEKGIEKAAIKTESAVFNLTPKTFAEEENNKEIGLSAKEIDRNTLTPLQKHKVPKGCILVDLNAKAGQEKVSNFNEPIEVSVPYKGIVKKGEVVQVFLLKDNGTIESMGGVYDADIKMVTFTTPHFSKYFAKKADKEEIQETKVTFKDLKGYEWAKEAIEAMANKGIINGRGEAMFDPTANITRAEFATLVTKMMGYSTENMNVPFTDVAKDAWYCNYVGAAYKNGLINGRNKTVFDPNGKITRQEMVVIVAKVLEKKGYSKAELKELEIFKDQGQIAPWAKDSVSLCVKEKIISGMGNNTFAPTQNANRAQATVMINRVDNLMNK
ncbi:S-layer homology domain-containing protein [Lutibacter sp. B2]|nr:S-layer homology domain-containing protein [Lutibacter sp. B2]